MPPAGESGESCAAATSEERDDAAISVKAPTSWTPIRLKDVTARLRSFKPFNRRRVSIECENVDAIVYRDILELYLAVSGTRDWEWVDRSRNVSRRQRLLRTVLNLGRDLLMWPLLYLRHSREVKWLSNNGTLAVGEPGADRTALYLRTDHGNPTAGGSVTHTSGVINAFRKLGYRVAVISSGPLKNVADDRDFFHCRLAYGNGRNIPELMDLLYTDAVTRFAAANGHDQTPSFLYQRYSRFNYAAVRIKQKTRLPYVCEFNGSEVWMSRNWGKGGFLHEKLAERIELLNLSAADLVVVVSEVLKEELVTRGVDPGRILVNPNGVDPDLYSPEIEGGGIRDRHGLRDKTVLGFIGSFGPWHGAEVLAEAFGRLLDSSPDYRDRVRVLWIGDGRTLPKVKSILEKNGALDSSVMVGLVPQEEGPAHLAACDVLVSPHVNNPDGSPFFGSPTKLFEYMAMGKGIVASDLEQIGAILRHDVTAYLVRPGDPEDLCRGIRALVDDPDLRGRLGRNARSEALARCTWVQHTERMLDRLGRSSP